MGEQRIDLWTIMVVTRHGNTPRVVTTCTCILFNRCTTQRTRHGWLVVELLVTKHTRAKALTELFVGVQAADDDTGQVVCRCTVLVRGAL